jgi:hypothetical protein
MAYLVDYEVAVSKLKFSMGSGSSRNPSCILEAILSNQLLYICFHWYLGFSVRLLFHRIHLRLVIENKRNKGTADRCRHEYRHDIDVVLEIIRSTILSASSGKTWKVDLARDLTQPAWAGLTQPACSFEGEITATASSARLRM